MSEKKSCRNEIPYELADEALDTVAGGVEMATAGQNDLWQQLFPGVFLSRTSERNRLIEATPINTP